MERSQFLGLAFSIMLVSTYSSCTRSDGFFGRGGNQGVEKKPEVKPPVVTPKDQKIPPTEQCTHAKLISVRSQKTILDQRGMDRTLPIELTFQPCPTQTTSLQLPVKFDLDADMMFPTVNPGIPYQLSVNGAVMSSGFLTPVQGSDLFDKTGPQYVHFLSSSPLNVAPNLQSAVLTLDIGAIKVMGPINSNAPATTNFTVSSHVRVGDPQPVTGQILVTPP